MKKLFSFLWEALLTAFFCAASDLFSAARPPLAETGSSDFQNQRADSLWYCKTIWSFSEGKTHVACV